MGLAIFLILPGMLVSGPGEAGRAGGGVAMTAGAVLVAGLLLAAGGSPDDVTYLHHRALKIPLDIDASRRELINQLVLYSSTDQGRTWHQYAVAGPEQDAFKFYAPADGLYWFTVEVMDKKGNRSPPDIYQAPPSRKIFIDSQKPELRIVSAQRQDDEVEVAWETQEDHPDLSTLKLEYRTPDAPAAVWYSAPLDPQMNGRTRFHPNGTGPVSIRMRVEDLAKNLGTAEAEVPAAAAVTTAGLRSREPGGANVIPAGANAPGALTFEKPRAPAKAETAGTAAPSGVEPPAKMTNEAPSISPPAPAARPFSKDPSMETGPKVLATSDHSATELTRGQTSDRGPQRGPLPPLQLVHSKDVTLEYKLEKVGPSGVGEVLLYLTQDDGLTWKLYAEDDKFEAKQPVSNGRLQRSVPLPGEGVFGIRLVVNSRAAVAAKKAGFSTKLIKLPPSPGDLPQMRIEVDTTPPVVELLEPKPDPERRDCWLLGWTAHDPNHSTLASRPITLQWSADNKDGTWQTIEANLPNTGQYCWQVPSNLPDRVYLRVIARDAAGNSSAATTPEPVPVDPSQPEGVLLGVVSHNP
jgi:hypothetical protein